MISVQTLQTRFTVGRTISEATLGNLQAVADKATSTAAATTEGMKVEAAESFAATSLQMQGAIRRLDLENKLRAFGSLPTPPINAAQTASAPTSTNFVEQHPAAQGLTFSETKSASDLAYAANTGEVYQFPNGKQWEVIETVRTPESGFRAVVLKPVDANDNRVIVAYAGSGDKQDWKTNVQQAANKTPEQYRQAADLAREYQSKYGDDVILTGHSLGGGLASYASLETDLRATAINSAPLSPKNLGGNPLFNRKITRDSDITQYYAPGECLTDYDKLNLREARPGNEIAIPGKYRRLDPRASIANHLIENVAIDVPPPVRVS